MTTLDRERLRKQIVKLCAVYRDTRFDLPTLVDRLCSALPDLTFSESDVLEGVNFLEGMNVLNRHDSELLGPPKWQISMQGRFFHERNP